MRRNYCEKIPLLIRNVIKGLQAESRQEILIYLLEKGKKSFIEISDELNIPKSNLSHHLKILIKCGLIYNFFKKSEYNDKYSYYKLSKLGSKVFNSLRNMVAENFSEKQDLLNRAPFFNNMGLIDEENALKYYEKILKFNSKDFKTWVNKGVALRNLGEYGEALKSFEKALELNPNDIEVWNNKGVTLGNLGKFKKALKSFEKALKLNSNDVKAWNNKGVALGNLGKFKKALKSFEKALKLNSNDIKAWSNKGIALGNLRKYQEALKSFEKAFKLKPKFVNIGYTKADIKTFKKNLIFIKNNEDLQDLAQYNEDFKNIQDIFKIRNFNYA